MSRSWYSSRTPAMSEQNQIPTTKICRVDILIVTYGKLKAPGNTSHTVSRDE